VRWQSLHHTALLNHSDAAAAAAGDVDQTSAVDVRSVAVCWQCCADVCWSVKRLDVSVCRTETTMSCTPSQRPATEHDYIHITQ